MSVRPGMVELAGSMAGPWTEWPLQPERLRAALRDLGAPEDALTLHSDGGWLTIEPGREFVETAAFGNGVPAEILAAALQNLHGLMPKPSEEWASTLRLTEYQQGQKVEALFGLTAEGVQAVGRQTPWQPVPEAGPLDLLRKYWLIGIMLLVAIGGTVYLNWDQLMEGLKNPTGSPVGEQEDGGDGGEGAAE